ncbi:hypothetical protein CFOL_v3_02798 [Cephalotus follicularis]|uniref:Uncharacterized protein n=1 Tax=Cephalotus follicularis TaxID=3775 RepID=A0A1Q3AU54_CEPFO|nr:hypothetical protein CFOL_v3_02798 [Cephalotus follicularis]
MKGRESSRGAPSSDLLVCFPRRAHLTLMPKPICSPARPTEPNKRHHSHNNHHLKRSSTRGGGGGGHASSFIWDKNKQMASEPTSPKVTCAGQIKVRHKTSSCKSWQSVMEEIERIHNNKKHKKRPTWGETLGFKKEIMQFLTCLGSLKFDFRCFGSFPQPENTSDDEEEDDEYHENHVSLGKSDGDDDDNETSSRTIFSKWFMVLHENQSNVGFCKEDRKERGRSFNGDDDESVGAPAIPPPNALLLMRCRSAPAKSWLQEKHHQQQQLKDDANYEDKEEELQGEDKKKEVKKPKSLKSLMEEEKRNNLVVMSYDSDLYKISSDIAKETWVVGGMRDLLPRSRSWKR